MAGATESAMITWSVLLLSDAAKGLTLITLRVLTDQGENHKHAESNEIVARHAEDVSYDVIRSREGVSHF